MQVSIHPNETHACMHACTVCTTKPQRDPRAAPVYSPQDPAANPPSPDITLPASAAAAIAAAAAAVR